MPKKILTQELEGTRRRGRPRKRWKEKVERDLHVLGMRTWRGLVADRKKWKDIFRQAKAHSGLQCKWKKKKKKMFLTLLTFTFQPQFTGVYFLLLHDAFASNIRNYLPVDFKATTFFSSSGL